MVSTYKPDDPVWIRARAGEDRFPAVIERVVDDGFWVLWVETDQHVHVPAYAVVALREVEADE